jgi:hypothetical protein
MQWRAGVALIGEGHPLSPAAATGRQSIDAASNKSRRFP